jgi:hypothetical protein
MIKIAIRERWKTGMTIEVDLGGISSDTAHILVFPTVRFRRGRACAVAERVGGVPMT